MAFSDEYLNMKASIDLTYLQKVVLGEEKSDENGINAKFSVICPCKNETIHDPEEADWYAYTCISL